VTEYSGIARQDALDSEVGQIGSGSTSMLSSGVLQTTCDLDLVVGLFNAFVGLSPGPGFEQEGNIFGALLEDDLPGGAIPGSNAAAATAQTATPCWTGAAMAFKAK
jgi:hypothetical protein